MDEAMPPGFEALPLDPGFTGMLGTLGIDRGRNLLGWRVRAAHANPAGMCHGGALATFADCQAVLLRAGKAYDPTAHSPTISLSVDYLAPIPVGSWVEAAIAIDRTTRSMIFSRATFTVDGAVVARSSAIYRNHNKTGEMP